MTAPRVDAPARGAWVTLDHRPFDRVADIVAALDEVDEAGTWSATSLERTASFAGFGHRLTVVTDASVVVVLDLDAWAIVAIGEISADASSPRFL